jgi:hypothetical protein
MVLFILQSFDETRWLAALMGMTSAASAVVPNNTAGTANEARQMVE